MAGASLQRATHEAIHKLVNIYPNLKKTIISSYAQINARSENYIKEYGEFGICEDEAYKKYIGGIVNRKTMPYNAGQWYPVQEAFKAIENPEQYDVIFRTRFDIDLWKPVRFLPNELVAVGPGPKRLHDGTKESSIYNIKNHMFYGQPGIVEFMQDIYDKNLELTCKFTNLATNSLLEYYFRNNSKNYPLTIDNTLVESTNYGVWK
ncbi:MAG: hypothetical protein EBS49_02180 [Verrucomicrobia bacterium]|nr:hypothetical protein [Verrucomicrobiota bacterium]